MALIVMYTTLEDQHNTGKVQPAAIPKHAAVYLKVGKTLYSVTEAHDGALLVGVQQQLVIRGEHANHARLSEEPFK